MPSFVPDADVLQAVANILKVDDVGLLPAFWTDLATKSNAAAYQDVVTRLLSRGFSEAVVAGWDRRVEFQTDLALYWSLIRGGAAADYDTKAIDRLDRRGELATVMVTVGGHQQNPGGAVSASEMDFTPITSGNQGPASLWDLDGPRWGRCERD